MHFSPSLSPPLSPLSSLSLSRPLQFAKLLTAQEHKRETLEISDLPIFDGVLVCCLLCSAKPISNFLSR